MMLNLILCTPLLLLQLQLIEGVVSTAASDTAFYELVDPIKLNNDHRGELNMLHHVNGTSVDDGRVSMSTLAMASVLSKRSLSGEYIIDAPSCEPTAMPSEHLTESPKYFSMQLLSSAVSSSLYFSMQMLSSQHVSSGMIQVSSQEPSLFSTQQSSQYISLQLISSSMLQLKPTSEPTAIPSTTISEAPSAAPSLEPSSLFSVKFSSQYISLQLLSSSTSQLKPTSEPTAVPSLELS